MKSGKNKKTHVFAAVFLTFVLLCSTSVSYAQKRLLVPVGKTVGVTVNMHGISVVNTAEFETADGRNISPAKEAGICAGDVILKINGKDVCSSAELVKLTEKSGDNSICLTVRRDEKEFETEIKPEKEMSDGVYKLGVWIKDSSSGIGTLTYYDPETLRFGALGHGICNDELLTDINGGEILNAEVASLRRGEKGAPGELIGVFTEKENALGEIFSNTDCGIFGKLDKKPEFSDEAPIETASREEVTTGEATILSNVEGDEIAEYSVEIVKINKDESSLRGMIIRITDDRLIEKTGGILQGMSGSPIIQNGKLIGAVTHVFVNDPTRGYGIFIENMLAEAEKIK